MTMWEKGLSGGKIIVKTSSKNEINCRPKHNYR